jgi:hypothetical protein
MMWRPFRRDEQVGGGAQYDQTAQILSWAQRALGEADCGMTPVLGLAESPPPVGNTTVEPVGWLFGEHDESRGVSGQPHTEVAKEPDGDGARAEPSTTIVVVTTQSPEASEGEAHIFGDAQEAKLFVERLIDDGFDRERIKTIRGGQTQLRVSSRAVVDFD